MTEIPVRELRNHVSEVLRRVESGEELIVTVSGRPSRSFAIPQRPRCHWDEFWNDWPKADPVCSTTYGTWATRPRTISSGESVASALGDTSDLAVERPATASHAALRAPFPHHGRATAGVLQAPSPAAHARRLQTLLRVQGLEPLPVDGPVAAAWAELRGALRELKRRMPVNDSWIAATAIAHGLPLVTQDDDYADVPGLDVIRI